MGKFIVPPLLSIQEIAEVKVQPLRLWASRNSTPDLRMCLGTTMSTKWPSIPKYMWLSPSSGWSMITVGSLLWGTRAHVIQDWFISRGRWQISLHQDSLLLDTFPRRLGVRGLLFSLQFPASFESTLCVSYWWCGILKNNTYFLKADLYNWDNSRHLIPRGYLPPDWSWKHSLSTYCMCQAT